MSQRFSAKHRYLEILNIFQRWPGIGHFGAKRLFQAGSSQKQFTAQLKRLSVLFDTLIPCPQCLIPNMQGQECVNCSRQKNSSKMVLVGVASDAFVLDSFMCLKDYYVIALPGYISPQSFLHAAHRQVTYISKLLTETQYQHCLVLFNQSIEARSTLWLLKEQCPENVLWLDGSFLTLDKDSLGHFSDFELKNYEQQLHLFLQAQS